MKCYFINGNVRSFRVRKSESRDFDAKPPKQKKQREEKKIRRRTVSFRPSEEKGRFFGFASKVRPLKLESSWK